MGTAPPLHALFQRRVDGDDSLLRLARLRFEQAGLAAIVWAAAASGGAGVSLTLEIHQAEGRRPLGDAAGLFGHWRDLTNAERMNHWLLVLTENSELVTNALR